ncbi:MAG: hypothetical protein V4694_03440 [Pseudomonadota bacterium]
MQQFSGLKKFPAIKTGDLVLVFFILTRIIAFVFSYFATDVPLYLIYFQKLDLGLTPYSQFTLEYPPLTLIFIYFPGLFLKEINFVSYYVSFVFLMFLTDFFCLKICQLYCKKRLLMNEKETSYMSLLYTLFTLAMFRLLYHRLDLVIAVIFTISLFFFEAKNPKLKLRFFINTLLGFFFKIVPAFTLPIAIIFKSANNKKMLKIICQQSLFFIASLIIIISALEIYTDHTFIKNMMVHSERGIQIESTYASILMFNNLLHDMHSPIYHDFGSWNIKGSFYLEFIAKFLGNFVLLFFYAAIFWIFFNKNKRDQKITISESHFLDATLITILLLLSFQKVFSLQFLIWLAPIAAIWLTKNRSWKFLAIFAFIFLASSFIFSSRYFDLVDEKPIFVTALFLRNILLVIVTCFLTHRFLKNLSNV